MDLSTFIVSVFCLIDDRIKKERRIRRCGPTPKLSDAEVLTIEVVGEFLGIDTDKGIYCYFRRHYGEWFAALKGVHRTTFCRQAANLWAVKEVLWKHLLGQMCFDPEVSLIDSFPVPTCHFARAYRCRRLAEESAFGYDEMTKQTFYGLRAHLRVCWPGVIVEMDLAPANVHETCAWPRNCSKRRKRAGSWATGTTGVPSSPRGSQRRGSVCSLLTNPRKGKGGAGQAGWCKSVAGSKR
jgi:hypothetical protein